MRTIAKSSLLMLVIVSLMIPVMPVGASVTGGPTGVGPMEPGPYWAAPPVPDAAGRFTENLGQWDEDVRFVAEGPTARAGLCPDGVVHQVTGPDGGHRVKVAFTADGPVEPYGVDDLGYPTSYFMGNDPDRWVTKARSYREVVYPDVWPGVDVRYYYHDGNLKYDLLLDGDADPSSIRFEILGGEGLDVSGDSIVVRLSHGMTLQDRDLVAWYDDMEPVDVGFVGVGDSFGFSVDKEPGRSMVIDPVVVHSSTFVGGVYGEGAMGVGVDKEGNLVIASGTGSTDFPTTLGAYNDEMYGSGCAVTKLNHNASSIVWSAIISGSRWDFLRAMDLDEHGNVYFAGMTWSEDYPVTPGAVVSEFNLGMNNNQLDGVVTKISSSGDSLLYSTYMGGSSTEWVSGIAVWKGMATVVGSTHSYDFPTEYGSYGGVHGDGFLVMLGENGSKIVDTHFWGGFGSEHTGALAFDKNGDIVVTGRTTSIDMFTTPMVIQPISPGFNSGFLCRYSPSEDRLLMSTYFGTLQGVGLGAVTVDEDLNIYVSGVANRAPDGSFPLATPGAFNERCKGYSDAMLAKLDPNATRIEYCTLLGGDGAEEIIYDVEVDGEGNLHAAGSLAVGTNFTVTPDCHDPDWAGDSEAFLFVLNANGSAPIYSSFHGGDRADAIYGLMIDDVDNWVIAGTSESRDMPITDDAYQKKVSGDSDSFVSIVGEHLPTSAPLNLTAVGREGHIELEWQFPEDNNGYPVKRFIVYRGTSEDDLRFHLALGTTTIYIDKEVEWGVYYHYAVLASNGKGISPRSNIVSARSVTVPDGPLNFTAEVRMDSILFEWQVPDFTGGLPLTGFMVYRTAEGDHKELVTPIDADATSFEDFLVEDGTNYTYAITALNEQGESRQLVSLTVRTHAVPTPPMGLDHWYGDLFIGISWEPPISENGLPVTNYTVHRREGDGPVETIGQVTSQDHTFVDRHVQVGVVYTYTVRAQNGKGPSAMSEGIDAKAMVAPDPPQEPAAVSTAHFIRITWSPPGFDGASPILGYRVYLVKGSGDAVCLGGPSTQGVTEPVLAFLHEVEYDGVSRRYYVTALNAEGESGPSTITSSPVYQVPQPPADLETIWGEGSVEIRWDPPTDDGGTPVLSYTLYRLSQGEEAFVPMVSLSPEELSFRDMGLINGETYAYRLTATNLVGESEPTAPVEAIPAGLPGAPEGLQAEGGVGTVHLSWGPPLDHGGHPVSGYTVYRTVDGGSMEPVMQLDGGTLEWDDTEVEDGVQYLYSIEAHTDAGTSVMSEIAGATPFGPPTGPVNFIAHWVDGQVHLTWSAPLDDRGSTLMGYRIHRHDRDLANMTELSPMALTFLDREFEPGATYNYTIYAYNSAGVSVGAEASITIPLPEPGPPKSSSTSNWAVLVLAMALLAAAALLLVRRGRFGGHGPSML